MASSKFIQRFEKFELQAYSPPKDFSHLRQTHVAFAGAPRRHPLDEQKIVLVPDPFGGMLFYYEFRKTDIGYAEKLRNLVGPDGEVLPMARLWIRKGGIGLRCTPFRVEETDSF